MKKTLLILLYISLIHCQPSGLSQCSYTFSDNFCQMCNVTSSTCFSCYEGYTKLTSSGLCWADPVENSASRINNAKTTSTNIPGQPPTTTFAIYDPYYIKEGSCASLVEGNSSVTRYMSTDSTCHISCDFGSNSTVETISETGQGPQTMTSYSCSSCPTNTYSCINSSKILECSYSVQRFQSPVTANNFLSSYASGNVVCGPMAKSGTQTLIYYVKPFYSVASCNPLSACTANGTTTIWDDLTLVFLDIISNSGTYLKLTVKIYLLKNPSSGSLTHFVLDKNSIYSGAYDMYVNSPVKLARPFERQYADVYIGPYYCSMGAMQGCLSPTETPTIRWNSYMTHIFVTGSMTVENVIFEFGDLAHSANTNCRQSPTICCFFDGTTSTPTSNCERKIDYNNWDQSSTSTYESTYHAKRRFGIFTMQFLRDYSDASVPSLTFNRVIVQNFLFSAFHTSFVEIDRFAGIVTMNLCIFDRFMFPHGVISNSNYDEDRKYLWETRYDGKTCRTTHSGFSDCHGLTIIETTFKNYNPFKAKSTTSVPNRFEGSIVMLHNFDGPIVVKGSTFHNTANSFASGCYKFNPSSWGPNPPNGQAYNNIEYQSQYKIYLDKHFRKYAENININAPITAPIFVRNLTKGLVLYDNNFNQIYSVAGGSVYVQGFSNTYNYPIVISKNTFYNNFAEHFALNIMLFKLGIDFTTLSCHGIFMDNNNFTSNYGCYSAAGNVVIDCEPNEAYNGASGSSNFESYYTKYNIAVNQNFETKTPSTPYNATHYIEKVTVQLSSSHSYTDATSSSTFDPYKVTISNNYFYDNHAIISNCLYIEGVISLYIYQNTFILNSINRASYYSSTFLANNAWAQVSTSTIPSGGSYMSEGTFMVESSPLIIRIAHYVNIDNNTFDGNTQGLYGGELYFAQAITLQQIIGKESNVINNCIFQNHKGFSSTDATSVAFPSYAATAIITLNYYESWDAFMYNPSPKTTKNNPTYLNVTNSYFYNNYFSQNGSADIKGMYFKGSGDRKSEYPYFNSGFFKYFMDSEIYSTTVSAYETPPVGNSAPPTTYLYALYVNYAYNTYASNTFGEGLCGFSRYGLDALAVSYSTFTSNSIPETLIDKDYYYGMMCVTSDSLITWTQTPYIDFSHNTFTSGSGILLLTSSVYTTAPKATSVYMINFNYNTVTKHTSDSMPTLYLYYTNLISLSHLTFSNVTLNSGFAHFNKMIVLKMENITITDVISSRIALFQIEDVNDVNVTNIDASSITFSKQVSSDDTSQILNAGDSTKLGCLIQFKESTTVSNLNIHDISEVETIFAGDSGSITITNSSFYNIGVTRALAPIFSSTSITCSYCTIYNIAASSNADSALFSSSSGTLNLESSKIYNLTGSSSLLMIASIGTINIQNTSVTSCTATSTDTVPSLIKAQLGTISIKDSYFAYNTGQGQGMVSSILSSVSLVNSIFEKNSAVYGSHNFYLSTLEGSMVVNNCGFKDDAIYDFESTVSATFIYLVDADLEISGSSFSGAHNNYGAIYMNGELQTLTIEESNFSDCYIAPQRSFGQSAGVIYAQSSLKIYTSYFKNNTYPILIGGGTDLTLSDTNFVDNINLTIYIDSITKSQLTFVIINGHSDHSTWSRTKSENPDIISSGIFFLNCPTIQIYNSSFLNLNHLSFNFEYNGAAIQISNPSTVSTVTTSLSIFSSTFINNIAENGGALYINAPTPNVIQGIISNSVFTNNSAIKRGGAIYYHGYNKSSSSLSFVGVTQLIRSYAGEAGGAIYYASQRPSTSISQTFLFVDNEADYGPNYASYPVSLGIVDSPDSSIYSAKVASTTLTRLLGEEEYEYDTLEELSDSKPYPLRVLADNITAENPNFVSGQYQNPPVVIALLDLDGQTCKIWSTGSASIIFSTTAVSSYTSTTFSISKGYIIMYPMKLTYTPGASTNATITTSVTLTSAQTEDSYTLSIKTSPYFRECIRGERQTDSEECLKCSSGLYILSRTSKGTCAACPSGMNCFGGDLIGPSTNYWRLDGWKSTAKRCQNDEACLGYYINDTDSSGRLLAETSTYDCTEKYNSTFCYTGWCATGYKGNLCATCASGYAKSNQIYCVPCSDNPGYYVLFIVILFVAVGFIVFTVKNAIKVKPDVATQVKPKSAILMKILTNYLQLVSIVASFNFKWPDEVTSMFSAQTKVASSSSTVFSIDCFYPEAKPGSSIRPFFVKLLFLSLSPILLVAISALVWFIVLRSYANKNPDPDKRKIDGHEFKSRLTTTCVVLLFMIHTNIVQTALLGFKCDNLGNASGSEVTYYLDQDLDIECYTGLHLYWSLGCALPAFIFWGLGIPLFALRLLRNNKKRLEDVVFKSKFGFLYDGYRFKTYYWEFVVLYRKIAMVFISIFLVTFGIQIQALAVLGVCFLSYVFQIYGAPFTTDDLNEMEKKSMLNATITLYAGIYFVSGALPDFANWILLIVILVVNAIFLLGWAKELLLDYKRQFEEGKKKKELAKLEKEEEIKKLKEEGADPEKIRQLEEGPPKKPKVALCGKKKPAKENYEAIESERTNSKKEKTPKKSGCHKNGKTTTS